uniref:Uncharacterized protein n=1 Tax=Timema monikensis TaxID=170555 RepID=A0A7R9HJS7_9NEOP|nr:unnamed protein product [Timema monikensis]
MIMNSEGFPAPYDPPPWKQERWVMVDGPSESRWRKAAALQPSGYIGESHPERAKVTRHAPGNQFYAIPNPIITVTEHTPTPSPDYMRRQFKRGVGYPLNFPRPYCFTHTMLHPHVNHPNYFFPWETTLRDPAKCARVGLWETLDVR